jgi:hypothetical protein
VSAAQDLLLQIFIVLNILSFSQVKSGMVVHACNPSYSGSIDLERSCFEVSPGEKVSETFSTSKWVWWHMLVVLAMRKAVSGRIVVRAWPWEKFGRPYLEKQLK